MEVLVIFSDYLDRLSNIWDYNEYVTLCDSLNVTAMTTTEYYNYVGNITGIMFLEKLKIYKDAYLLFIQGSIPSATQQVIKPIPATSKCGSCGGGKVL
jgi:hypothetical protein